MAQYDGSPPNGDSGDEEYFYYGQEYDEYGNPIHIDNSRPTPAAVGLFNLSAINISEPNSTFNRTPGREVIDYQYGNYPDTPSTAEIMSWDDAAWVLTNTFIIFTMQSGFALLEAGFVSVKNEVNLLVKNTMDIVIGGLAYWIFGFGFSFGSPIVKGFMGAGFFVDADSMHDMGATFANYLFQKAFATTATTIVSGAMAERTRLKSYAVFSFFNTVIYVFPAHWIWAESGFLKQLGFLDIAGAGAVHLLGGVSGLVATVILKPRNGRFDPGSAKPPMGSPANCIMGLYMLWWGWLGVNSASSYGVSGGHWKLATRAAVTTMNSSIGGGCAGFMFSVIYRKGKLDVSDMVNSILGGLVAITASCALVRPWEALIIGAIGGTLAITGWLLCDKLKVDDPVGAIPVHGMCGMWSLIAVGFFVEQDSLSNMTEGESGVLWGGSGYLLAIQLLGTAVIIAWTAVVSFLLLMSIHKTMGLRMSKEDEELGADWVEHGFAPINELEVNNFQAEMEPLKTGEEATTTSLTTSGEDHAPKIIIRSGAFGSRKVDLSTISLHPSRSTVRGEDIPRIIVHRTETQLFDSYLLRNLSQAPRKRSCPWRIKTAPETVASEPINSENAVMREDGTEETIQRTSS